MTHNKISYFKNDNGNRITDPQHIIDHAFNYFSNGFTTTHTSTSWNHITRATTSFHTLDLSDMDRPLYDQEIITALFSFQPYKAPGPDGLHPQLFLSQWKIVGKSVLDFCHQVFHSQFVPSSTNTNLLCLISKFANANHLKNFRPISLCNNIYKVIIKIIVNRIKAHLIHLIGPF